ncbi:hypothetical protein [Trichocoleus sp. DQ-U1]
MNQAYDYIAASNPDTAAGSVERIEKAVMRCAFIPPWVDPDEFLEPES